MYVQTLHIYNLRCFVKQVIPLCYPGCPTETPVPLDNVTLLVGNNGAGKTTILKACALATLSPVLMQSGLVPYHLVRRPIQRGTSKTKPYEALVKANALLHPQDVGLEASDKPEDLLTRLQPRGDSNYDVLINTRVPQSRIADLDNDRSPSFFTVGYGATRRVESGEDDTGSRSKRRTPRYQRVAGLFEDHVALRPLDRWLRNVPTRSARFREVLKLLNGLLPSDVRFSGTLREGEYYFEMRGVSVPFAALSDGYRAFIGWAGDLLGHMVDCCPAKMKLPELTGLVLVDEVDLHLHPEWQRHVVPNICKMLPKLQFVFSTHSPIVAGTATSQNLRVMEVGSDGGTDVKQYRERVHGLGADQVLMSAYFDMKTTRAPAFENELDGLARKAAEGDSDAAVAYIQRLAGQRVEDVETSRRKRESRTVTAKKPKKAASVASKK